MNAQTIRHSVRGPVGDIECAVDAPASSSIGTAVICHPHPLHGGTLDNKVVQTIARACVQSGWRSVRFNFRGVGASQGQWDEGMGEVADCLAVVAATRGPDEPLLLAGFSFGAFVAAQAAHQLAPPTLVRQLVLVGPSTQKQHLPAVPADTLVIHGESDDVVPLSATFDWARPQSLPVIVFPGVGHFFHGQLGLLKRVLLDRLGAHAHPTA